MSYSFTVKAANKAAAKEGVVAEFAKVVATQLVHEKDQAAVLANAFTIIELLAEDDTKDVLVSCNGYISWAGPDASVLTSVNIACSASHATRKVDEPVA